MDVSSIASAATEMSAIRTNAEVGTAVLKKAIDIQAQGALTLLDALSQAPSQPSHIGQNINTAA